MEPKIPCYGRSRPDPLPDYAAEITRIVKALHPPT